LASDDGVAARAESVGVGDVVGADVGVAVGALVAVGEGVSVAVGSGAAVTVGSGVTVGTWVGVGVSAAAGTVQTRVAFGESSASQAARLTSNAKASATSANRARRSPIAAFS
jgi:hypothetical protein